MTESTILNIPFSKVKLKKIVDDVYQTLAIKHMTGNIWVHEDSPDKHIVILVHIIRKALNEDKVEKVVKR